MIDKVRVCDWKKKNICACVYVCDRERETHELRGSGGDEKQSWREEEARLQTIITRRQRHTKSPQLLLQ